MTTDMSVISVPDGSASQDGSPKNLKPVPDGSRTGTDGCSGHKTDPVPDHPTPEGGGVRTGPDAPSRTPLHNWLTSLPARGVTITIEDDQPILTGPTTGYDHHTAQTYRHALTIAAARDHTNWWNHILGRTRLTNPDDIPWTCATCSTPNIEILDNDLICWCTNHLEHANTTGWPNRSNH